jgi:Mrp family chromosome partitioning ATPase
MSTVGHRVLLVDSDLRRPQVMHALGLSVEAGDADLNAVFNHTAPDTAIIHDSKFKGLAVVELSRHPDSGPDIFRDQRFAALLERLSASYDFILFDTPPILALHDAWRIAQHADVNILVSQWRRTSKYALKAAGKALEYTGAPLSFTVLNAVDVKVQ